VGVTEAAEHRPAGGLGVDVRAAISRLGAGVALVLIAFVVFAGSRWIAGRQQHAYDPGATPPSNYRVTQGRPYQLSSGLPVKRLLLTGVLSTPSCLWTSDGQVTTPLSLTGIANDERNRHQFATFDAPTTGPITVTCADVSTVFIDDADNRTPDWAAVLMMVAVLLGLTGAILAISGGYDLTG